MTKGKNLKQKNIDGANDKGNHTIHKQKQRFREKLKIKEDNAEIIHVKLGDISRTK